MPDKIDKYVVDNELIDKGWEQMQAILDKEMPINQKKRRIVPIWWWSSGVAASLLLATALLFKESKPNLPNQNIQNQIVQSTINEASNESASAAEKNDVTTQTNNNPLPIDKTNTFNSKSRTSTEADAIKMKNSNHSPNKAEKAVVNNSIQTVDNQDIDKENTVEMGVAESSIAPETNVAISSQTKTEAQDNAVRKTNSQSLRSTLAYVPTLAIPFTDVNSVTTAFDLGMKKASVATKLPRKFRHGIFGRINYMGFIDNGFSFGYLNQYRISNRHHLQTRLYVERNSRFVHTITETYILPKQLYDSKGTANTPNVTGDTIVTQVVYPFYENCACAVIAKQNNLSSTLSKNNDFYVLANSWHLGLSANYAYRISPRWEVSSGFGLSYAAKALEYTFAISSDKSLLEYNSSSDNPISNTGSFSPSTSEVTNAAYVNFAKEQEIFSRLDGYWEIGMNFYVNKRLTLGGGYRRGLIDITKNDALRIKDYNRAVTMQSIFFF